MKKFFKIFILIILLGLAYQFRAPLEGQFSSLQNKVHTLFAPAPCAQPIPYNLGTFDTQFGISKADFLSALTEAEGIWSKPFGKQFFIYSPTDTNASVLKINLVYDYRQQATSKLAGLGIVAKNDQASYDSLKAKYTQLQTQYTATKNTLTAQVESFQKQQQAYNAEVDSWNKKGGAPQADYDRLQTEKSTLDTESAQLQTSQNNLNGMVDEINALVVVLNRLVATLNLSVNQYNTVNGTLGDSFEEGVYVEDGPVRHIDIYEYSDHNKLVRVLAHELGHALGLQHVTDPKAIMYKFNQGTGLAATQADINELKTVCGIK